MSVQNGLFDNVMTDVSGKVRLESEDPRWIQLFSTKTISQLSAEEVGWYAARLIEHNPATGNLIQMLDQTSSKLQQVTSRRTSPPSQLTEQCCSALFLTTLLLHHIIAHSSVHEVSTHQLSASHCFTVERSLLKFCIATTAASDHGRLGRSRLTQIGVQPGPNHHFAQRRCSGEVNTRAGDGAGCSHCKVSRCYYVFIYSIAID
jgi:hypothetical protein